MFTRTLWHMPQIKEKHVRCNQSPFVTKQLRQAMMIQTRLLNKYRKYNSAGNLFASKRQINFCVKLLRKFKVFYNNFNIKRVIGKIKFWQTIKPNFKDERISLVDHNHKKRKDNLEGSLIRVLFAAELEFLKTLVPRIPQHTPNVNIESTRKSKQLFYVCEQLLGALIYLHLIVLILIWF